MSEADILIDSDAFLILAGAGRIDSALELLGFNHQRAFRLSPLPQMIGRSKPIREKYPAAARRQALMACSRIRGIVDRPDDELFQRLIEVRDIDDGEALLYGLLAERPLTLLASGDKRAMIALCSDESVADIQRSVAGRVICLESVLRRVVARDGVAAVAQSFLPVMKTYKTLQIVFSEQNRTDESQCLVALDSCLDALKRQVGEGFLYEP